jgi:hypothetical protein
MDTTAHGPSPPLPTPPADTPRRSEGAGSRAGARVGVVEEGVGKVERSEGPVCTLRGASTGAAEEGD